MTNFFVFLSLIPQRLLGVWVFMFMFQQLGIFGFDLKDLLLLSGQVLGVIGITFFTVPKEKIGKLLEPVGISYYTWIVVSGLVVDLLFVAKDVFFYQEF